MKALTGLELAQGSVGGEMSEPCQHEHVCRCDALEAENARLKEERDRYQYASDKQAVAWKERAMKAERQLAEAQRGLMGAEVGCDIAIDMRREAEARLSQVTEALRDLRQYLIEQLADTEFPGTGVTLRRLIALATLTLHSGHTSCGLSSPASSPAARASIAEPVIRPAERCEGRYSVPQTSPPRTEPFDITYRCGLPAGHAGPHCADWASDAFSPAAPTEERPACNCEDDGIRVSDNPACPACHPEEP